MAEEIIDIKGQIMESSPDPIDGSGIRLTNANANTNATQTVVAGATYVFTSLITGGFYFATAGTTQTAANVRWVCPASQTIYFKVPIGITTLNFATDTANGVGYLRRIR
jgi:hypothetical protein